MAVIDDIKKLTKILLPTGRAFRMPKDGEFQKLMDGLALSEERLWADTGSTLDSIIPDNNNFSADDATLWEKRYGLITSDSVSLTDRKAAIIRKMNHPGNVKPRQNYRFIQAQLRLANFDVYLYENLSRLNPLVGGFIFQHGDYQHGDAQHGGAVADKVARSIYSSEDADFDIGTNYSNVFWIGGATLGTFANVDADRETEFRDLILRLKPLNQIAYLVVNYV